MTQLAQVETPSRTLPLISARGLHRHHGQTHALRGVDVTIRRGEIVAIMGPSGSGKSTLLHLLAGLLAPDEGRIEIGGRDLTAMGDGAATRFRRRRIGVVFQDFRLLDHLTTYENVALPYRVLGKDEASYRADVADLLDWVGLGDRKNVFPPVLSGGEKQRAAIARALITKPEFLLADEPTGNVDPPLARRLLRLFRELNRLGTAVLIATHDIGLMDQLDARRMVLEGGHLEIYE